MNLFTAITKDYKVDIYLKYIIKNYNIITLEIMIVWRI